MIWIVPIEPIDQRYTKQWYENIPKDLDRLKIPNRTIGDPVVSGTTTGAFLDFSFTNKYKAKQVQQIADLFSMKQVTPGDKFLVTDAWNFAITTIRYMSDLLDIPVEIHGIWHAGNYDPSDILGMKMTGVWASDTERGWYHACDYNYFATEFHKDMFLRNLNIPKEHQHKAQRSGQSHEAIILPLLAYVTEPKKDIVVFPHRYNADKQPEIAEQLNLVITQKMNLNKQDYYQLLGSAKALFSCALHENLGISMMEGCLAGAIPIVPDRCSYSEMYLKQFKYPSQWTSSLENFHLYKKEVIDFIEDKVVNYKSYLDDLEEQRGILITKYLQPTLMYRNLMR
jgi:hypothetical protein